MINRIKYKDFEISFSERLKQIPEDTAEAAKIEQDPIEDDEKISELISISPASSVIEAWKSLEISAGNKVKQLLPKDETFRDPFQRPIDYLDSKGTFPPSTASAIRELRLLRNQVVHAWGGEISREDAFRYAKLVLSIRRQIDAVIELPKVKLTALTLMVLEINHLLDSRKFGDITITEVSDWIDNRDILSSLHRRTGGDFRLGDFAGDGTYPNFGTFYHDQMKSLRDAYAGDEGKKWGVENMGLCLLLAWTNELIQQGAGWHPSD